MIDLVLGWILISVSLISVIIISLEYVRNGRKWSTMFNRKMKSKLEDSQAAEFYWRSNSLKFENETEELRVQLADAHKEIAKLKLNNKYARYEQNSALTELDQAWQTIYLLRNLVTSQGAVINEEFNK